VLTRQPENQRIFLKEQRICELDSFLSQAARWYVCERTPYSPLVLALKRVPCQRKILIGRRSRSFCERMYQVASTGSTLPDPASIDFFSQALTIHTALVLHECLTASVFSIVGLPPCGSMMKQVLLLSGKLWNSRRPPSCSTILRET
jgi:hypothetical protein